MRIDVLLPSTLLLITVSILFLNIRYEGKVRSLVGGRELRSRDAVLLVAAMGVMVTILAFIPKLDIILVLFLGIYCAPNQQTSLLDWSTQFINKVQSGQQLEGLRAEEP